MENIDSTIMIVDDSEVSRMHLSSILKRVGYERIITAPSAPEAISLLEGSQTEGRTPADLILMDFVMPEMNGIEAARAIKSDKAFRDIPIIMVTVSDDKDNLEKAFEAGAMDFINKPVDRIELRARVASALKLKKETDRRKSRETELVRTIHKLKEAMTEVKTLSGLLPICANCKNIRDDSGYWQRIEEYFTTHSHAEFTHGICPECMAELYPEIAEKRRKAEK